MSTHGLRGILAFGLALLILCGIGAGPALAHEADWADGDGVWSDPNNWQNMMLPAPGDDVSLGSGDTITLDIDASVGELFGIGTNFIIAGTTLDASGQAIFQALTVNSGGTASVSGGIVTTGFTSNGGTTNAEVTADTADIENSSITAIVASTSVKLSDSTVGVGLSGWGGTFTVTNTKVAGTVGFTAQSNSSITDTSVNNIGGAVQTGAKLTIDNSQFASSGGMSANGGLLQIFDSTNVNNLGVLDAENGGIITIDNSTVKFSPTGFDEVLINTSNSALPTGLFVQNGAVMNDNGNATAQLLEAPTGSLQINSGGSVNIHEVFLDGVTQVSGAGSQLFAGKTLVVIDGGSLSVQNGGTAGTLDLEVGSPGGPGAADTLGSITVNGAGSLLTDLPTQLSFPSFYGSMTLSSGGAFTNSTNIVMHDGPLSVSTGGLFSGATLDLAATSPVTATIDGAGSKATLTTSFSISGGSSAIIQNKGALAIAGTTLGTGLFVGDTVMPGTTSALTIQSGGTVSTGNINIGEVPNSTGTVTVSGAGSQLSYTGALTIGDRGIGTLTLQSGGVLSPGQAPIIANAAGSTGNFTVAPGSTTTFTGTLIDGNSGAGTMTIAGGATVTDDAATIAAMTGSISSASVSDSGSIWNTNGNLIIAGQAGGALTVQNGATVNNALVTAGAGATVAQGAKSSAVIGISGPGAVWNDGGNLVIGDGGMALMVVSAGGALNNGQSTPNSNATIANAATSNASLTITDANSQWNDQGSLTIAENGTGVLTIQSGAAVTSDDATIADANGSTGTTTVTGAGSMWTITGDVTVANAGTGTLNVLDSAMVGNSGDAKIGDAQDSTGTATVTASQWILTGELTAGGAGTGDLTVSQAGALSSGSATLGESIPGTGTITITDAGSQWKITGDLTVGASGSGALAVANGATVTSAGGTLGENSSGTGAVTVGGSGAAWTDSEDLTVGASGTGTLEIDTGGTVTNAGGSVAQALNSQGTVNIFGGTWDNTGDLSVAQGGGGTMTITGSGAVTDVGGGTIGENTGAVGKVTLMGTGSTANIPSWHNLGPLTVGDRGKGELDVLNQAVVTSESGDIGSAPNAVGIVKIDGAGSQWIANEPGDTGIIEIGEHGMGTLIVSNHALAVANAINVDPGGTLAGVGGTIQADVNVTGGTIAPGDPGPMTITGAVEGDSDSNLLLQIAGPVDFDSLAIGGDMTFSGAVTLDFLNGYAPPAGTTFDFVTDSGGSFAPAAINFVGVTPGAYTTSTSSGFSLTATGDFVSTSVPEPAAGVLLMILAIGLALRRRVAAARAICIVN